MAGGPNTPEKRATVAGRRVEVLGMRMAGMTYKQIADEMCKRPGLGKYTDARAAEDVKRALAESQSRLTAQADLHLAMELERLDALRRTVESTLSQARRTGEKWIVLRSVDRLLDIGARQDKLLAISATSREAARPKPADADGQGAERPQPADVVDIASRRRADRRARSRA